MGFTCETSSSPLSSERKKNQRVRKLGTPKAIPQAIFLNAKVEVPFMNFGISINKPTVPAERKITIKKRPFSEASTYHSLAQLKSTSASPWPKKITRISHRYLTSKLSLEPLVLVKNTPANASIIPSA